jgi:hypothetical protein
MQFLKRKKCIGTENEKDGIGIDSVASIFLRAGFILRQPLQLWEAEMFLYSGVYLISNLPLYPSRSFLFPVMQTMPRIDSR